ncbi:hypothetical protein RhiLY_07367 [Ceratobasidium sp. AG-Ba]|nr:hypothetical protein RhiLY_07367 [Ceratobasidium sp. AG-Ba]
MSLSFLPPPAVSAVLVTSAARSLIQLPPRFPGTLSRMKLSVPVVFAAAAGLVNAAPIVVYVKPRPVSDAGAWTQNVRWGHAAANAGFLPPLATTPNPTGYYPPYAPTPNPTGYYQAYAPTPMPPFTLTYHPAPTDRPMIMTAPNPTMPLQSGYRPSYRPDREWIMFSDMLRAEINEKDTARRGGCHMRKMRHKSLQWGLSSRLFISTLDAHGREIHREYISEDRWLKPTHRHHMRPSHHNAPFYVRLTHALSSLGPWEGRAVSFVLGCGLGVLLRMLYVFAVLIVRGVRCRRAERRITLVEDSVIFVADVKEPVTVEALPGYTEKAETAEAKEAPQTNNTH